MHPKLFSERELTKLIFPCEEELFILLLGRDMGLNVVHFKWLPANYYGAVSDRTTLGKEWIYDFVRLSEDSDSMPERKKKDVSTENVTNQNRPPFVIIY